MHRLIVVAVTGTSFTLSIVKGEEEVRRIGLNRGALHDLKGLKRALAKKGVLNRHIRALEVDLTALRKLVAKMAPKRPDADADINCGDRRRSTDRFRVLRIAQLAA